MQTMNLPVLFIVLAATLTSSVWSLRYPDVKRDPNFVDYYHGTQVRDPYRGLENPESFPSRKFLKAQKRLTEQFFSKAADRDEIQGALKELSRFTTFSPPLKKGNRYFYTEHNEDEGRSVIYVREKGGEPRILVDSTTLSRDGAASLGPYTVSQNGQHIAYSFSSKSGSDWKTVHFRNVASGNDLDDKLEHTKNPALAWSHDNEGVFYTRYPLDRDGNPSHLNNKVYYHKLGTSQYEDTLVAEFPSNPMWILNVKASDDGKYVIVSASDSYRANAIYIAMLDENPHRMNLLKSLVPIFSAVDGSKYTYVTNLNSQFLFLTDENAANGRLIVVDIGEDDDANRIARRIDGDYPTSELLPEDSSRVLSWVRYVAGDYLVLCYLDDAKHALTLVSMTDTEKTASFPFNQSSSITEITGGTHGDTEVFLKVESFLSPGKVYRCDLKKGEFDCKVYRETSATLSLDSFEMKQEFYDSKDGTPVPMYIVHKKGLKRNGSAPLLLHGDGGLNRNSLPVYSIDVLAFVQLFDGVYAVPNIRGGGEYGEQWHEEGSRLNKQNTFDDFQAAATYLIKEKYTKADKLAIRGALNGGLVVAACINQKPDLFGAAVIEDGLLDMLRFQKFTGGYSWCAEYGCSDNKEDFKYLYKYSPLHNIQVPTAPKAQYPAVLVMADEQDDRVVPAHSYKYIAELQNHIGRNKKQSRPLILRLDQKPGADVTSEPREADILLFIADTLNLEYRGVTILEVQNEEIEEDSTESIATTMMTTNEM